MTIAAGTMTHRVRFERREIVADDYGNTLDDWASLLPVWAGFKATPGREALEAGRLESTFTGVLMVRRSASSLAITAADRGVFTAGPYSGAVFNIRSIVPSVDASMIEMTIEQGVAT